MGMLDLKSVTVLTTPENADWYRSVLGSEADFRFSPKETHPLETTFANLTIAGGSIVVVDERHCLTPQDMALGIRRYSDETAWQGRSLRIVAVCPERSAGDELLAYLTTHCGVYDVIYGEDGAHIAHELSSILQRPRTRRDVLHLLDDSPQRRFAKESALRPFGAVEAIVPVEEGRGLVIRISIESNGPRLS